MDNLQPVWNGNVQNEENDVKDLGLLQRIIGVVMSPTETMKSIVAKPKVLFPILAMAIAPVLVNIIRLPLYRDMQRDILIKSSEVMSAKFNTPPLSPADIDNAVSANLIQGLVGTPIVSIIMWLIGTAIMFGLFKIFGGQGKYKQYLAVNGYAYVITLISLVLTLIVSFGTNSLKLDLSLGVFAPQILAGAEGTFKFGFLYTVLTSIGVFNIWGYVVTAIGLVQLSKLSNVKVYYIVISIYLLTILFGGAVSGLTEAFMSGISSAL